MIRWKRTNLDSGPVHQSQGGNFEYKIVRVARGVYELFQECSVNAVDVRGKPFTNHFEWYYLTNFKSPNAAREFVVGYDSGKMGLTPWEREPFVK